MYAEKHSHKKHQQCQRHGIFFFANIADYLSQSRIMANMMTRQEALTLEPNLLPMMMLMMMMTMTMTTATTTTKVA